MNRYALILATYLLRRRAELNLTIDEAADRAGIASDEWLSLEHGRRVPNQDDNATFNAVADALETSPTQIAFLACVAEHNQNRGAHERA